MALLVVADREQVPALIVQKPEIHLGDDVRRPIRDHLQSRPERRVIRGADELEAGLSQRDEMSREVAVKC